MASTLETYLTIPRELAQMYELRLNSWRRELIDLVTKFPSARLTREVFRGRLKLSQVTNELDLHRVRLIFRGCLGTSCLPHNPPSFDNIRLPGPAPASYEAALADARVLTLVKAFPFLSLSEAMACLMILSSGA